MNQNISQTDDPFEIGDFPSQRRVGPGKLAQRLPNDRELSLDRRQHERIENELLARPALEELVDSVGGVEDILEKRPAVTPHTASYDCAPCPRERMGWRRRRA